MANNKRFKLKITIMPLFQLCRSKRLSKFPGNPVPAIYRLSPVNPKAFDIAFPNQPAPPPSSPEINSRPPRTYNKQHRRSYADFPDSVFCESNFCKIGSDRGKKVKSSGGGRRISTTTTTATASSRRSNFQIDNDEESESLISCLTSFSDEFFHESVCERSEISRQVISTSSRKKIQRQRFQGSEKNRETIATKTKTATATETSSAAPMRRHTVEGKVKESFAVVKRSKDPHEDFKKSMLEMIIEMEMFEAKELEQLLQSFLTLNSRCHHAVIARAFMEIWQELFCEPRSSSTRTTNFLSKGFETWTL